MNQTKNRTRRITLQSTAKPKRPPREKPVPVIVEVAADGFIQVYGPRHVRPIIFNRLVAVRPEETDIVDEFHEYEIPRGYREYYFPKHILKTHLVEKRTLEREVRRRGRLAMLREFRGMAEDAKKGSKLA